jgi:hypothetical protein
MNASAKGTVGQAIDQALAALGSLDKREQQIAISTICSLLDLAPNAPRAQPAAAKTTDTVARPAAPEAGDRSTKDHDQNVGAPEARNPISSMEPGLDIRTLRNQKQPASAPQMACLVAFYLQEHAPTEERTREVTAADMERLFKQAGFKLPSRMQQVLVDAKNSGYFDVVDRGRYRLTRVGYNLVTHSMPKPKASA